MAWEETSFVLTCKQSGVEHHVTTAVPRRYESLESAPLILCLDGAWTAGTVRDATRIMSMSAETPEAIVVGLSFTDASMSGYLRSRASWFTPTPWVPPPIVGVKDLAAEDAGQALTYLAFIRDQLLPRLAQDFRISERWLVGHSFSGLFGLRALLTEPALFDKYLLASPSIWWDDRAILQVEQGYADAHSDLDAAVFMTGGEHEGAMGGDFNMVGNVIELAERLEARGYPSLRLHHQVLAGESHSSTIGAAVSHGLRLLHLA